MALLRALTAALLSTTALAQTLNGWPAAVFGDPTMFDGNVSTTHTTAMPSYDAILFNSWHTLAGLYIQSSGDDFITDYYVTASVDYPLTRSITVGQVCGATSNFTLVRFADNKGNPYVWSDTYFIHVTAAKGNVSIINEVWPIYVDDVVFDPENTTPCPPATSATPAVRRRTLDGEA